MSLIWYIIIGAIAGFIAGKIMQGKGFGFFVNLCVGIIGGVLGGWMFSFLGIQTIGGPKIGGLITATVGAIVLLCFVSLFRRK